ncbi:MAG: site-specific DNA-methyltransferase [Elusimicrobiaceae bacterium]|nr:site-specific DNA-methyltransferase [Elusimicrobiaceae bacterium]
MNENNIKLVNTDCTMYLDKIEYSSVDMVLSDIPYGISYDEWDILHNNHNSALGGTSPSQQKAGSVFKKRGKPLNGWSSADKNISNEYYEWCSKWMPKIFNILKPGASAFIFAGRRMSHKCISAMEDAGFIFKDMIAWEKNQAPHRAQKVSCVFNRRKDEENSNRWKDWRLGNLRPIFEPILWFMKPYKIGGTITDNLLDYELGAFNNETWKKYNSICANTIKVKHEQSDTGFHPTQKPVMLMESLIELVTKEGQIVLDPFMGSGSTGVACQILNRKFIGIEIDKHFFKIAEQRILSVNPLGLI